MKDFEAMHQDLQDWRKSRTGKRNPWAKYIVLAIDLARTLQSLTAADELDQDTKDLLLKAYHYFLDPHDLIPDTGPDGLRDDVALMAYVLHLALDKYDESIISKHVVGEHKIGPLVQAIINDAEKMVGKYNWLKLRAKVSPQGIQLKTK